MPSRRTNNFPESGRGLGHVTPQFLAVRSAILATAWLLVTFIINRQNGYIAASIVHSKLDYCNSLYYNLPKSQINRLQQIQNCLARTVVKASKSSFVTPILRSLHWLKINERIEYKLLSLTYKVLTTRGPGAMAPTAPWLTQLFALWRHAHPTFGPQVGCA